MSTDLNAWRAAGEWDAEHGLMPMATFQLAADERAAYVDGYRRKAIGVGVNRYRGAERPPAAAPEEPSTAEGEQPVP
jgi:hypothetical protein